MTNYIFYASTTLDNVCKKQIKKKGCMKELTDYERNNYKNELCTDINRYMKILKKNNLKCTSEYLLRSMVYENIDKLEKGSFISECEKLLIKGALRNKL